MSVKLFEQFPPVPTEAWRAVIEADLKGADFERKLVKTTLDGVRLTPFSRSEDLPAILPDLTQAERRATLREEIREPHLAVARGHALAALGRGAEELSILNYPFGPEIRTQEDFRAFTDGIYLEMAPMHWLCGPMSAPFLAMIANEVERRGLPRESVRGSVDHDPILDRCAEWTESPLEDWKEDFLRTARWTLEALPSFRLLCVRGGLIEKAGASLAQEMAYSLALLSEYLAAWTEAGHPADELLSRTEIRLGVGTNLLLEVAKLRAMSVLLGNLVQAYGGTAIPHVHVVTTSSNKTLYDAHNNLLRGTLEAVAAVLGGCDSLSVAAYDQGYHTPDEFSEHLARNTRTLLAEEARLLAVRDPLGGSYTVERLTADYAEAAWTLFRSIEAQGGWVAAWKAGTIQEALRRSQAERTKQLQTRRRTIVGTTVYPNPKDRKLGEVQTKTTPYQVMPAASPEMEGLQRAYANGATLQDWMGARRVPSTALDPYRPSWPYEHLRLRLERHAALGGKIPTVVLALLGDPKMARARATFCAGFYGMGGLPTHEVLCAHGAEAAEKARRLGATLLVLCSADAEYPDHVAAASANKPCPLVVAGYPQELIESLVVAGADDFVHLKLDPMATLDGLFNGWGIEALPTSGPLDPRSSATQEGARA